MRDGMSFPVHIVQGPIGHLKLKARKAGDAAELARLQAAPLPELPEVYRKQPIYYITNRFSVKGPNTTVKWPRYSEVMDYELEFGIVTKNRGANISAATARSAEPTRAATVRSRGCSAATCASAARSRSARPSAG